MHISWRTCSLGLMNEIYFYCSSSLLLESCPQVARIYIHKLEVRVTWNLWKSILAGGESNVELVEEHTPNVLPHARPAGCVRGLLR